MEMPEIQHLDWRLGELLHHALTTGLPDAAAYAHEHLSRELRQLRHEPDLPVLLLDDHDLDDLVDLARRFRTHRWVTRIPPYLDYRRVLPEIKAALGGPVADRFARLSLRLLRRLRHHETNLHVGAKAMRAWIEEVRALKRAMGLDALLPRPDGKFPTPRDRRPFDGALPTDKVSNKTINIPPDRDMFNAAEAAKYLGLDRLVRWDNALKRLIRRGDLPDRKIGGRRVYPRAALDRLKANGSRKSRLGRPPGSKTTRSRAE